MWIDYSPFLIFMPEDLLRELYVHTAISQKFANLFLNDALQFCLVKDDICLTNFFLICFVVEGKLDICNFEDLELILYISFFGVVDHCQVDQMLQFLFIKASLLTDIEGDEHDLDNVDMIFFGFGFEQCKWILFHFSDELLELRCAAISHLD